MRVFADEAGDAVVRRLDVVVLRADTPATPWARFRCAPSDAARVNDFPHSGHLKELGTARFAVDFARTRALDVWEYPSPIDEPVLLENARGGYLIDGRGKAYWTTRRDGYRGHQCRSFAPPVTLDDFLWT